MMEPTAGPAGLRLHDPRPHDLLWVDPISALRVRPDADDRHGYSELLSRASWADAAWLTSMPVVVRRDTGPANWVPVGLRGRHRHERCAAWLPMAAVVRRLTPEDVAQTCSRVDLPASLQVPAITTLADIAPRLDEAAIRWGVGGSVGFALATRQPILRADSDLDLIVRADSANAFARMIDVLRRIGTHDVELAPPRPRIDIQIDTPAGGFALAEWLRTGGPVLLKTARGPVLVQDPWAISPSR